MAHKVLLVEDNPGFLAIMSSVLRRKRYQIAAAEDGSTALGKAASENPDIIFLDLGLPDMSGVEVISLLKSNPITEHIPVIICTAYVNEAERKKIFQHGAVEIVTKPVTSFDLLEALQRQLPMSRAIVDCR
jgi:CheY-like chemotaxis protein